ncbi:MAG: SDR family NAD(P)-dependent oxidoreductase [Leptospiraceae bacterium]|nr:SDR family NAD(P)-dependent oxidoreductase [Leptospiraceae bacterium]
MSETNKLTVITGCSSGIGKHIAIEMAKLDYKVLMLVRDSDKSRDAYNEIVKISNSNNIKMLYTDFASLDSIRSTSDNIIKEYSQIDILINNAGVIKRKYESSGDGYEMTFAVNYLATFLLTNLLLPLLKNASFSRVINLSSELYKNGIIDLENIPPKGKFNGTKNYADSKLLINIFTKELAERIKNDGITVNCLHPGVIGTDAFREYPKIFVKLMNLFLTKPEKGALPVIRLATSPEYKNVTGQYFNVNKLVPMKNYIFEKEVIQEIWNISRQLVNI